MTTPAYVILLLLIIRLFAFYQLSASHFHVTNTNSVQIANEVDSLLTWKSSLDLKTQKLLSSWIAGVTHCNWSGIHCNIDESITGLNLAGYGLQGTLSSLNFSSLTSLEIIDFSGNYFYGNISFIKAMSNLQKLKVLYLYDNQFSAYIPQEIGMLKSLVKLDLSSNAFTGQIPPEIGNLSMLTNLSLSKNHLYGFIPKEVGKLTSLQCLRLSKNNLSSPIVASIGNLSKLVNLSLSGNQLYGYIPKGLGKLKYLQGLWLHSNNLSGQIPTEIGNLSKLMNLSLGMNQLCGSIPKELGKLKSLQNLGLYSNNLSDQIPSEIGNLSELIALFLFKNQLSGSIPKEIGNLPKLINISLGENQLYGSIPKELGNLKSLQELRLYSNNLSGQIPSEIGNLSELIILSLDENQLYGSIPTELNNLTGLRYFEVCDNHLTGSLPESLCLHGSLETLIIENNKFSGRLPKSLKNCTTLERVRLESNELYGDISKDFGIYPKLDYIDLSYNNFYGRLSSKWALCPKLTALKMAGNRISGNIPLQLGNASQLRYLDLSSNQLVGKIPGILGKLSLLYMLKLDNNRLTGNIPLEVGELSWLEDLNLASNKFVNSIPPQIGRCQRLITLNLSRNMLVGKIPPDMLSLKSLENLDLSHNILSAQIPPQVGELTNLQTLDLSHNNLSASIPSTIAQCVALVSVDISYNHLEGPIPNTKAFLQAPYSALSNNIGLCGNHSGLMPCSLQSQSDDGLNINLVVIMSIVLGSLFLFTMAIIIFVIFRRKTRNTREEQRDFTNKDLFTIWSFDGKMTYESIIEATGNFDSSYCIGVGGHGSVFRAELPSGQIVAVKKFHTLGMQDDESWHDLRSFSNEISTLTNLRHRNIVKLYGFCAHNRHSFLIYEYLQGGSLAQILNDDEKALQVGWLERIIAVKAVAKALAYMHHDCLPPIIHRDISSNNILFDSEHEAHVSDFGTARFLSLDSSNWTSIAGTMGYTAPEFAYTAQSIWNINIPSKISIFMWRLFRRALPFPEALRRFGVNLVTVCPFCWNSQASMEHCLFSCDVALAIWHHFGLIFGINFGQATSIRSVCHIWWIHANGSSAVHTFCRILPSYIIWGLWTAYNSAIFDGTRATSQHLINNIRRQLFQLSIARPPIFEKSSDSLLLSENLIAAFAPKKKSFISWIKWLKPPSGRLKLNTDAAFSSTRSAGGACIRDSRGYLIAALAFPIDASSALEAETLALDFSLHWCNLAGKWPHFIEVDSKLLASFLSSPAPQVPWRIRGPITRIKDHLAFSSSTVTHVYREANSVADALASVGLSCTRPICFLSFDLLPISVRSSFLYDLRGFSAPRRFHQ